MKNKTLEIQKPIAKILILIGVVITKAAGWVSVGYGLYLWGYLGNPVVNTLLASGILWSEMFILGIFLFIIGVGYEFKNEEDVKRLQDYIKRNIE